MKRHIKAIMIVIGIIITLVVTTLNYHSIVHGQKQEYSDFWKNPSQYDVWITGTSHAYYAFYPTMLYEKYGISSYNIAAPTAFMPQIYWTLKCALKKAKPQIIVLDTYHVQQENLFTKDEYKIITWSKSIPMSITKIQAIYDLFPEKSIKDKIGYALPNSIFCKDWDIPNYSLEMSLSRGCEYKYQVKNLSKYKIPAETEKCETDTRGYDYLEKIIKLCKREKIQLILTALPAVNLENPVGQAGMNSVADYAKEYNLPFINYIYKDIFSLSKDIADETGHVNPRGGRKATEDLGKYIKEHYKLRKLSRKEKIQWSKYVEDCEKYKRKIKKEEESNNLF